VRAATAINELGSAFGLAPLLCLKSATGALDALASGIAAEVQGEKPTDAAGAFALSASQR
jgi:hypothetical protein